MDLIEQIKAAGVVGAGGAGFPTYAKFGSPADYLLMNAAECEPLLRVDQQLLAIYTDEILKGFDMAAKAAGVKKAIIGIKVKHHEVIDLLRKRIGELGMDIEVGELPDIYPAGDEQVLVYQLTGRVVPEAGIPINVGCIVCNAETVLNIYRASEGKAVTEKFITLAGDIPNRMTVKVPVGTPVIDVLKLSGIEDFSDYAVIDGGPMMGSVMADLNGHVIKKNKGFIILRKDHYLIRKKSTTMEQAKRVNKATCEQCRMCTDLCPRFLLGHSVAPHKMMRVMNYNIDDLEGQKVAQLCCQCGLCEFFSCPAGLHPKMANMYFKDRLAEQGLRYTPSKTEFEPRNIRDMRLVPSKRLVARIGLKNFDRPAPMSDVKIEPSVVRIALRQHVGGPAQPVVTVGPSVTAGQLIGNVPEGKLGATVHSSIDGTVSEVTADYIEIRR